MRLGLQTISWGPQIADLKALLSAAKDLGYEGLEFAQVPNRLPEPTEVRDLLGQYGLTLVGLAGGPIAERLDYIRALDKSPVYLYVDEWDDEAIAAALDQGFAIGLHPHLYKGIGSIAIAGAYMDADPRLGLIVDTAHSYLIGDDIVGGLEQYRNRLLAVHLKDWQSAYGRSPLRFARGFTALGAGELGSLLDDTVSWLKLTRYEGWVMVEQDWTSGDPAEAACVSREWLALRGL